MASSHWLDSGRNEERTIRRSEDMKASHGENDEHVEAPPYFFGQTANEAWIRAAQAVIASREIVQDGRGGATAELLHATMRISDPRQRWVLARNPAINPAFAIAETFWILGGRDDAGFVNFWNPALPRYAGNGSTYYGAYGKRLRSAFGLDQIERAIDALSKNRASRQVVLQIWDPRSDLPTSDGMPASSDIPCNLCAMLKVRNDRLEWMQVMRSNDIFRGTPYNIVQFTLLQEFIAGCIGVELGEFVLVMDSLHAYQQDLKTFSISPSHSAISGCSIALPRDQALRAVERCLALLNDLSSPLLTRDRFREIVQADELPKGHADLIRIAAADSARRKDWLELMCMASDACSDSALRKVWTEWMRHRSKTVTSGSRGLAETDRPAVSRTFQ